MKALFVNMALRCQLGTDSHTLQSDPENYERLKADLTQAVERQKQVQQRVFALADVVQRKNHFAMKMLVKQKHQSLMSNFVNVWNNCSHNVMLNVNNYVKTKPICTIQPSIYSIAKFLRQ